MSDLSALLGLDGFRGSNFSFFFNTVYEDNEYEIVPNTL